ncbi:MAG: ProQ/FINO family protein [Aromatoleum sp.]|jgi:ProP effector|uniref:ProQ/FINO family protein n=1 Tax=Aromatoleum sp. TaxID=2307007 RepID=UPI0028960C73|nr:ProQ/FINO family protein [Aromatoleum sp.]MDT3672367.1 ProQ/FINO family protein [Aromatoleum sp.]
MTTETRPAAQPEQPAPLAAEQDPKVEPKAQQADAAAPTGGEPGANDQAAKPAAKKSQIDARGLLAKLQEISPTFREVRPLALRIDKAIAARFPDLDRKVIRSAMRQHTASTRYLKAMEKATERFDLDGKVDGEVTGEQREHAKQTLKERFAEVAKRKKAALDAEKAQRAAEDAERRKAEKLQQLLGKFSKG